MAVALGNLQAEAGAFFFRQTRDVGSNAVALASGGDETCAEREQGLEEELRRGSMIFDIKRDGGLALSKDDVHCPVRELDVFDGDVVPFGWKTRAEVDTVFKTVDTKAEQAKDGGVEESGRGPGLLGD